MMQFFKMLFLVIMVLGWATACTTKNEYYQTVVSQPEVKASDKISSSLGTQGEGKDLSLRIQKKALDKEFLLMSSMIELTPTAQFTGLKSRVVAFKKAGAQLVMLEATHGHLITHEYPTHLILAQFPILSENDDEIVFDFNTGMSRIYGTADWFTQDSGGFDMAYSLKPVKINMSYIEEVKEIDNTFVIRQVAQVEEGKSLKPVEAKYYLTPYKPSSDFQPTLSPGLNKVGYFEVAPQIEKDGKPLIFASKFNINKPIVFALSANTPEEVRQAIKDGVLYWNKVLGPNKVQVLQLTDPKIVAPDLQYNVIQWLDYKTAGYAYADAQMDPRTGEILHAQIYIPDAFYSGSRDGLLARIRSLQTAKKTQKDHLMLRGFGSSILCRRDFTEKRMESLQALALSNVSEDVIKKALLDMVTSVISHEVGHTLGFRHNFAGSLESNLPRADIQKEFQSYIEQGGVNSKNLRPSSSVMEYIAFEEDALTGSLVGNPTADPLLFDLKSGGVLYLNKPIETSFPLFCTDSQMDMTDCQQMDSGPSVLEDASLDFQSRLDSYPSRLLNIFLNAKAEKEEISSVSLDASAVTKAFIEERSRLMSALSNQAKYLKIRKSPSSPQQAHEKLKVKERGFVVQEIKSLGGLSSLLPVVPDDFSLKVLARLEKLLQLPEVSQNLSQSEKDEILSNVKDFLPQLQKELIEADLKTLALTSLREADSKVKLMDDETLRLEISQLFKSRVEKYSLSKSSDVIATSYQLKKGDVVQLKLPVYQYPLSTRIAALNLFDSGLSTSPIYGYHEKISLKELLDADLKPQEDVDLTDETNKSLTDQARIWILENKEVSNGL